MIRVLALLCLVAPAFGYHGGPSTPGLMIRYGSSAVSMGSEAMVELPVSNHSALTDEFTKMNRPRLPAGYCPLQLWCRKSDMYRTCIFTDETGCVAGLQFNYPCDEFTPLYDMKEQGFTIWTTSLNNQIVRFYAFYQFFVPPIAEKRIDSEDESCSVILRDTQLYYSGFGGKLSTLATSLDELDTIYTKQNCIKWLGHQYYYNMTKDVECSASTLSPLSAMFHNGHLVGTRISVMGTWAKDSKYKDLYEGINRVSGMYAVPNGPRCLFQNLRQGGLSMTFYFISTPWLISCIGD
ncbi:hypothetical protein PYW08_007476 [Mythimna loreyi]|uniref:Uncharacterized protein n=1 Tax=Mythimna loreyi TaxID=667449 RepID=A0ACC2QBS9_9NEOP|nr:hypothetical protein PYW08_007476 [Mythimna loreyi]